MIVYNTDFGFNNYISKCDLINKYNSLSTSELLKVSNICLTFDIHEGKVLDLNKKISTLVYLFSMFGVFPFLTISSTKSKLMREKIISSDNLSLNLLFDTPNEINSFLFSLLIENWFLISTENFLFVEEKQNLDHNLYLILSTRFFSALISNWITDLDFLNFKTKIKFKMEHTSPVKFNILKNFPLFWISG